LRRARGEEVMSLGVEELKKLGGYEVMRL